MGVVMSRVGLSNSSHCRAGWACGEEPRAMGQLSSQLGFGEHPRELQQVCQDFVQQRCSQVCHASRDGTWQRRSKCTPLSLGRGPQGIGRARNTRKSFCSSHSRGVSQVMAPEKHPLCRGPGQQPPNVLVEWRKTPAGTSPGAARQRPR